MKFYYQVPAALMGLVITLVQPQIVMSLSATEVVKIAELLSPTSTASTAKDFFIRGRDKYKKGDFQGAIADYNQALRLNPNDAEAYLNRGRVRSRLNIWFRAQEETMGAVAAIKQ